MNAETVGHFLEVLARVSAQAGVLVVVIVLAQRLFRRWLTPGWHAALWLLVVARLLLPVSLPNRLSMFNFLPNASRQELPEPLVSVQESTIRSGTPSEALLDFRVEPLQEIRLTTPSPTPLAEPRNPALSRQGHARRVSWPLVIFGVWVAGALILAAHVSVASLRAARRFRGLPEVSASESLAVLEVCRRQMRVRTQLKLVEGSDLRSPALHGILRPRLLLPVEIIRSFTSSELHFILLHELAHVRRCDVLVNWVVAVLQIVHWFNPVLWVGFRRWRADRELACDALALEAAGEGRNKEYGRTILRLLEGFTDLVAAPGFVGILEDKRQLQQRIGMIAAFVPNRRWSMPAAALLLVLAVVGLTDASSANSSNPDEQRSTRARPAASETVPAIHNPRPLANRASLQFRVVSEEGEPGPVDELKDPKSQDENAPRLRVRKEALLDRRAIESAKLQKSEIGERWEIAITLTDTAADKFSSFTEQNLLSRVAMVFNDTVLSVARINEKIVGKEMVLAGNFTKAEAEAIVAALNPDSRSGRSNPQPPKDKANVDTEPADASIQGPRNASYEDENIVLQTLRQYQQDYSRARSEAETAQKIIDQVTEMIQAGAPMDTIPYVQKDPQISLLTKELLVLRAKFEGIKQRYKSKYPAYKETEEQINSLRESIATQGNTLIQSLSNNAIIAKQTAEKLKRLVREQENAQLQLKAKKITYDWLRREADPSDFTSGVSALVQDGRLLIEMGKLDEAETKLREALKQAPKNVPATYYLTLIKEVRLNQKARTRQIMAKERISEDARNAPTKRESRDSDYDSLKAEAERLYTAKSYARSLELYERAATMKLSPAEAHWVEFRLADTRWHAEAASNGTDSVKADANPFARTNRVHTGPGRRLIQHKLDTIRLQEVIYDGVPLGEVVEDLVTEARRGDPEKRGINIIINPFVDVPSPAHSRAVDPDIGNGIPVSPPREPLDLNTAIVRLRLRDVTLGQVIEAVSKFCEKPLRWSIEEYGVVFTPGIEGPQQLFTRIFKVNPNTFIQGLQAVIPFPAGAGGEGSSVGGIGGDSGARINDIVRRFFVAAGVDFPTNAGGFSPGGGSLQVDQLGEPLGTKKALFFNDRTGVLFARATLTDLEVMDKAIQVLNIAPAQITLEVKFVELSIADTKMFGLDGSLSNTNSPITLVTGILPEAEFRKLLRTLELRKGVDILGAPKITTLGGRQARIELTQLKSVVLDRAERNSPPPDGQPKGANAYSMAEVPTGPSIDIIPDVLADGSAIDLTVIANLTEFLGYDDPGSLSAPIATEPVQPLPRFRVRKAMSTATVQDGQTLMLGGFVARDLRNPTNTVPVLGDIPLLGRFFRSEYASRTNKQLVVFVTPTIIDPAGNRLHPPENDSSDEKSVPAR